MKKIGWAVTGAGHLIREILDLAAARGDVELFLSRSAAEVLKMYRLDAAAMGVKIHTDTLASAPVCGKFAVGHYRGLVVAPASANSVAKFVTGVADTLVTNIFAQAGKARLPVVVFPTDVASRMETLSPSGPVTVYPRKIDLENTERLAAFEGVTVVRSLDELRRALERVFP